MEQERIELARIETEKAKAVLEAENRAKLVAIEAEKAKKAAQIKAQRIKDTPQSPKPQIQRSEQVYADSVRIIGKSNEQCVVYIQRIRGDRKAYGYAGDLVPEGQEPRVGAIALEKDVGHVSLVIAIDGDWLVLHDTNYVKGAITERKVHKSTQRGYIY